MSRPAGPSGTFVAGSRPNRGTNTKAILSLVFSLLIGLGSIVAIVLGILARRDIRRTGERGDGIALAGIIVGVLGLVLPLLAAIAIPVYLNQQEKAAAAGAQSDLRDAVTWYEAYYSEHGQYPASPEDTEFVPESSDEFNAETFSAGQRYCVETRAEDQWWSYSSTRGEITEERC